VWITLGCCSLPLHIQPQLVGEEVFAGVFLQGGMWTFAEAFHWSVWITLGGTALAVAMFITAAELLTFGNKANAKGLRGWGWYSVAKMVQVGRL
jgi:hypothetical protein